MPRSPWDLEHFRPRDEMRSARQCGLRASYALWGVLTLYREPNVGHVWVDDLALLPDHARASPLRTLLFWWLSGRSLLPVHGAVVAAAGRGVLIVGPSGSGKTTLVGTALGCGLDVVADDYAAVEDGTGRVHGVYSSMSVRAGDASVDAEVLHAGRAGEKRTILIPSGHLAGSADLAGILVLGRSGSRNSHIDEASPAEVLRVLGPSTVFQTPGAGAAQMAKCARLVQSVRRGRLFLGSSESHRAATLKRWLDRPGEFQR